MSPISVRRTGMLRFRPPLRQSYNRTCTLNRFSAAAGRVPRRGLVPVAGPDCARGLTDEYDLLRPNSSRGNVSSLIPMWVERAAQRSILVLAAGAETLNRRAGARATRDQG